MPIIPNKLVIRYMKSSILSNCQGSPTTMDILDNFRIDYSEVGIILEDFIKSLPVYTFTDLGLTDTTLNDDFLINTVNSFFIIDNEEITPVYILGISLNGTSLNSAAILENFSL